MTSNFRATTLAALMLAGVAGAAFAANPMVGGAPMYDSKNIVENAVNSKDHTTLVAAVKAAGLVETLEGAGPFTVFAPNNKAFAALPAGTVETLVMPENKAKLTEILTYHVVAGTLTTADLKREIAANGGVYMFKTVNGADLTAQERGGVIYIGDTEGRNATITIPDVMQSNGVIQGINMVLMPM